MEEEEEAEVLVSNDPGQSWVFSWGLLKCLYAVLIFRVAYSSASIESVTIDYDIRSHLTIKANKTIQRTGRAVRCTVSFIDSISPRPDQIFSTSCITTSFCIDGLDVI